MPKNKKNKTKRRKYNKCVYTDEAKRLLKAIKELKRKNKTRKNLKLKSS